jgi:predicted nucleotidyltransferase
MKYSIISAKTGFDTTALLEYFQLLEEVCKGLDTNFLVVGAFARDIIQEQIFGGQRGLHTKDIDIGILLPDWSTYEKVIEELTQQRGFRPGRLVHEFFSPTNIQTDILPFGQVEKERSISFPASPHFGINMMGFAEAWKQRLTVVLDGKQEINIPSASGIILLKLIAWSDRHPQPVSLKHITDIGELLESYYFGTYDEVSEDPIFADVYDLLGDDTLLPLHSAVVGGRKLRAMTAEFPETSAKLLLLVGLMLTVPSPKDVLERLCRALATDKSTARRVVELMRNELA